MGYIKDNFPGSPAFYLRRKALVALFAYIVGISGAVYCFAPGVKRFRKLVGEGAFDNPQWLIERNERRNPTGALVHTPKHQRQSTNTVGEEMYSEDFSRTRTWKYTNLEKIFGFQFNNAFVTPPPPPPSLEFTTVPTESSSPNKSAAGPSSTPPQQNNSQ